MGPVKGSKLLLTLTALTFGYENNQAADIPHQAQTISNHSLENLWETLRLALRMDQTLRAKTERRISALEGQGRTNSNRTNEMNTELEAIKKRVDAIYRMNIHTDLPRSCSEYASPLFGYPDHTHDGVYRVKYMDYTLPVYCDMSRDGGGWMLLVSNRGARDWSLANIRGRDVQDPGLDKDYSILDLADVMRRQSYKTHFEYRIEATGRGKWGGIWRAPIHYSLVSQTDTQTNVTMLKKFNNWKTTGRDTVRQRVPWIDKSHPAALLTTRSTSHGNWWGTLVMKGSNTPSWNAHGPLPWMSGSYNLEDGKTLTKLSTLYYWIRF